MHKQFHCPQCEHVMATKDQRGNRIMLKGTPEKRKTKERRMKGKHTGPWIASQVALH